MNDSQVYALSVTLWFLFGAWLIFSRQHPIITKQGRVRIKLEQLMQRNKNSYIDSTIRVSRERIFPGSELANASYKIKVLLSCGECVFESINSQVTLFVDGEWVKYLLNNELS